MMLWGFLTHARSPYEKDFQLLHLGSGEMWYLDLAQICSHYYFLLRLVTAKAHITMKLQSSTLRDPACSLEIIKHVEGNGCSRRNLLGNSAIHWLSPFCTGSLGEERNLQISLCRQPPGFHLCSEIMHA